MLGAKTEKRITTNRFPKAKSVLTRLLLLNSESLWVRRLVSEQLHLVCL